MNFVIEQAGPQHLDFADQICSFYAESAKERGTGIAKRKPEYIRAKMEKRNAIIATLDGEVAGFCYIEVWSHEKYVANSGLIIAPHFRKMGLAKRIKREIFNLARNKYPKSKVFGITTSLAVMRINSDLGYRPVTFSELTQDDEFWNGCKSCPNFDILERNERKLCLCTGMLAPSKEEAPELDLSHLIIEKTK